MNLPNLPTDNLYKFLTIFGLVIIIFAIVADYFLIESLYDRTINFEKIINTNNQSSKELLANLTLVEQKLTLTEAALKKGDMSFQEEESLVNALGENVNALYKKKAEVENLKITDLEIKRADMDIKTAKYFFPLLSAIGVILAIFGFKLWYDRLQKYLDLEIKNKVGKK